jgi:hypothetical protein
MPAECGPEQPGAPPCLQPGGLGLLLDQQLPGELADLGHAALPGLGGGEPAAGAVPCHQDRDEGEVERGPLETGQSLQVAAPQDAAALVAVAVGGEPALGQPPLELGHVPLAVPVDVAGEPGQLRIGEPAPGEVGDRDVLEQVGDHVLHEPHVGPVVDRRLAGGGLGAASRQDRDDNPASEPSSHPRPLAVASMALWRLSGMSTRRRLP